MSMAREGTRGGIPLVAVAAVAENGVIGRDNDLPWRLGTDLRRFRAITMGKPLIVGRRNWDSIGRPLPGRDMIVLTRRRDFSADGVRVVNDWDEARALASEIAARSGAAEAIVGGGAEIYRLAMPEIAALRLTLVHARPAGDVVFPPMTGARSARCSASTIRRGRGTSIPSPSSIWFGPAAMGKGALATAQPVDAGAPPAHVPALTPFRRMTTSALACSRRRPRGR